MLTARAHRTISSCLGHACSHWKQWLPQATLCLCCLHVLGLLWFLTVSSGAFRRENLVKRIYIIMWECLRRGYWDPGLLFSVFLLYVCSEVRILAPPWAPHHDGLFHHIMPQTNVDSDYRWKLWNYGQSTSLLLLSCLPRVFCYRNRKLTKILGLG